MKKTLLILVGITAVIAAIAAGVYLFGINTPKPTSINTTGQNSSNGQDFDRNAGQQFGRPVGSKPGAPSTTTRTITISNGGTLVVKDFLQDPETVKDHLNKGQNYLGYHFPEGVPDPTATTEPPYVIDYFEADSSFSIAIFQEPVAANRLQAEQYLMEHLGISQNQMCTLKYSIGVPNRVNQYYAGMELGFSFCPGAVKLAQ